VAEGGVTPARWVAHRVLVRVDGGAHTQRVLPAESVAAGLSDLDRRFASELVLGTLRRRAEVDQALVRHLLRGLPKHAGLLATLRLGAYQILFTRTAAHAAVDQSVRLAPAFGRQMVNAVLRAVAAEGSAPGPVEPALNYPAWLVEMLEQDHGRPRAEEILAALSDWESVRGGIEREDGYRYSVASSAVVDVCRAQPGELVADLCAAPGGKGSGLTLAGAWVVAVEPNRPRSRHLARTLQSFGQLGRAVALTADGRQPPLRAGGFDLVLVDAPCSGIGSLGRRPDALWRITPQKVERLAKLQRELIEAGLSLLRPGGRLIYSVCTLTNAETKDQDIWLADTHPGLRPLSIGRPFVPHGDRGGILWPGTEMAESGLAESGLAESGIRVSDGMYVLGLVRPE
jgi:16S rRNA (cytosine967-C5)-methyltransferase